MSNAITVTQLKYTFRKNRSQMVARGSLTLNTVESQEIMATYYGQASRYISEIFKNSLSVRSIEVYEAEREQFENITGDRVPMSVVRNWASESIMASVRALRDEVAKKESELMDLEVELQENYTQPVTVKLVLSTPEVNLFVSLIEAIDRYVEKIDQLWMRGELTVDEASAHKKPLKSSVAAIVQTLKELSDRVRNERIRLRKKEQERAKKKQERREARSTAKKQPAKPKTETKKSQTETKPAKPKGSTEPKTASKAKAVEPEKEAATKASA